MDRQMDKYIQIDLCGLLQRLYKPNYKDATILKFINISDFNYIGFFLRTNCTYIKYLKYNKDDNIHKQRSY